MSTIGDILNRTDKENAEVYWNRIKYLETENKKLRHKIGDWLRWCGYLEEGYRPVGLIETSTQILKENA